MREVLSVVLNHGIIDLMEDEHYIKVLFKFNTNFVTNCQIHQNDRPEDPAAFLGTIDTPKVSLVIARPMNRGSVTEVKAALYDVIQFDNEFVAIANSEPTDDMIKELAKKHSIITMKIVIN